MILEAILTAVIVLLFLLFIGIPLDVVLSWAGIALIALLLLSMAVFSLFFVISLLSLPFFKRTKGTFLRFSDDIRFDRAVYLADGIEYTCLFPAESVARRNIYNEKAHTLFVSRSKTRRIAYDRHSLLIIAVGSLFSALFIAVLCISAYMILS